MWPSAPANVIAALTAQPGLENPPWLQPGYDAYSAGWHAVERGDEAAAIQANEDPHRRYRHGVTLLMQAAARDFRALVQDLIGRGAGVNAHDDRGESALLKAVGNFKASLAVVQILVEHSADQLDESADRALRSGAPEIAEYLLSRGGRATDPNLLLKAARNGWTNVVSLVLAGGADPNFRQAQGGTPLMWAAKAEIIDLLAAGGGRRFRGAGGKWRYSAHAGMRERRKVEGGSAVTTQRKPECAGLSSELRLRTRIARNRGSRSI